MVLREILTLFWSLPWQQADPLLPIVGKGGESYTECLTTLHCLQPELSIMSCLLSHSLSAFPNEDVKTYHVFLGKI